MAPLLDSPGIVSSRCAHGRLAGSATEALVNRDSPTLGRTEICVHVVSVVGTRVRIGGGLELRVC
jgi:hypothetical protein